MKILIATDWYSPTVNGVVVSVLNLRDSLIQLGHDVRVITLSHTIKSYKDGGTYFIGSLNAAKIYPNARVKVKSAQDFAKDIVRWSPDVIHTQCEFSTFFVARKLAKHLGVPIVHTYHTVYEDYTHYFFPNKRLGESAVATFTRLVLERVDRVVVPTEKVEDILFKYGVNEPIDIIPTGIDLGKFDIYINPQALEKKKQEIGIPKENKVILYLGRLAKEKRLEELIDFTVRMNDKKITLLIVGGGPHMDKLVEYSKQSGFSSNIIFTGMVPPEQVSFYYRLGDVFSSASKSETQGLTYVECLACGIPAICRRDDVLDGVIVDGENGWQYDGFEDYKEYVHKVFADDTLREELSKNAVAHAHRDFSKEIFGKRAVAAYTKAVEQYRREPVTVKSQGES